MDMNGLVSWLKGKMSAPEAQPSANDPASPQDGMQYGSTAQARYSRAPIVFSQATPDDGSLGGEYGGHSGPLLGGILKNFISGNLPAKQVGQAIGSGSIQVYPNAEDAKNVGVGPTIRHEDAHALLHQAGQYDTGASLPGYSDLAQAVTNSGRTGDMAKEGPAYALAYNRKATPTLPAASANSISKSIMDQIQDPDLLKKFAALHAASMAADK